MLNLLRSSWAAECGSAALVFITAAIVGREAAAGMDVAQWTGAVVSVAGSISVAVMVHCWPNKPRTDTRMKAFEKIRRD